MGGIAFRRTDQIAFLGIGAHPWILERRNGLVRGIFNRLREDDRFSGERILAEVQRRLNTRISGGEFSASQMALWMGGQARGSDVCAGHLAIGPICTAREAANGGAGGNSEGDRQQ